MSDDLISRKALMEKAKDYFISPDGALRLIESQPTAYDVDKVVGKLETYISQQSENEMLSENGKWLVKRVIEECIKIVKSGGGADE